MRGASGACVTVDGSVATKIAPKGPARERLRAQHEWLRDHKTAPVVRAGMWVDDGYDMEVLHDWSQPYFASRLIAPAEKLWSFRAELLCDPIEHQRWVTEKILSAPEPFINTFVSDVISKFEYVAPRMRHLTRCLTHGDLTRSNTMERFGVSVLIDPIPATPACADIWVFDVSTVLISLLGLEHVCYGWPPPDATDLLWASALLMRMNPVELECVRYMGVVQIARRLPYFPEVVKHDGLINIARQVLHIRP